ncbi:hypothetical protein [Rhizobium johnstonii]|uniref:hypothetical protein n=1 Tax=Rhizobium johnstonii TaxID=3019933 RepID=UPI003F952D67
MRIEIGFSLFNFAVSRVTKRGSRALHLFISGLGVAALTAGLAEAKSKQIPAPNLPWKDGEVLILDNEGNHRMGLYDGGSVYFIYSDRLSSLTTPTTGWRLVCDKDAMTDKVNCMAIDEVARFGVYFQDGDEKPLGVKILEHDFPGESAMIRVGEAKPFTSDSDGWVFDQKLVEEIKEGGIVKTRIKVFPNKAYDDFATKRPVLDYGDAVLLMRHMQTNFGKISFDKPK